MEEIKVNDYVRTDDGLLFKADEYWYYECLPKLDENVRNRLKAKPNIIELIEVGDYVNGELITDTNIGKNYAYIHCEEGKTFTDYQIESVVTHEQFNSIKYEVE